MVDLMYNFLTLFQFFLRRETKKLIAIKQFALNSSGDIPTLPTATPIHNTFFNWNFTWDLMSVTLLPMLSACVIRVGNLPALFKPGPNNLGICGISTCDAKKASN